MSALFSIIREEGSTRLKVFGITLRIASELKLERPSWHHYGFYEILKQYTGVPFVPRRVNAQHGWTPSSTASPNDMAARPTLELAWNKRFKDDWERKCPYRCEVIGSPFVIYRRMQGIEQVSDAKGTIAFPGHSLQHVRMEYSIARYCELLRSLPQQFHPVTIALHPVDIERWHMDAEYRKHGFEVVSAGLDKSVPYYQKFYELLRRHKYATSNDLGSYMCYAVEMGIPFFLFGDIPTYDNREGLASEMERQVYHGVEAYEIGRMATELFSRPEKGVITDEQRRFVESELGFGDSISREELARALRWAAAKEYEAKPVLGHALRMMKLLIMHPREAKNTIRFYRYLRACRREQGTPC